MNMNRYEAVAFRTPAIQRMSTLRDDLDRLFGIAFPQSNLHSKLMAEWRPPLDVIEETDNIVVNVELPGIRKEDIVLTLDDATLTIAGERGVSRDAETAKITRCERFQGRFERAVTLSKPVVGTAVSARYTDGILTVTLPKAEAAKPRRIEVK